MLPQSPGVDPTTCIPELERCVKEYGFVGINLNPDPSGGGRACRSLTIYEKMIECDIPAMVHVSTSCNPVSEGRHQFNDATRSIGTLQPHSTRRQSPTSGGKVFSFLVVAQITPEEIHGRK
jgi:4-oxalmesaconate hydratase